MRKAINNVFIESIFQIDIFSWNISTNVSRIHGIKIDVGKILMVQQNLNWTIDVLKDHVNNPILKHPSSK